MGNKLLRLTNLAGNFLSFMLIPFQLRAGIQIYAAISARLNKCTLRPDLGRKVGTGFSDKS